MIGRLSIVMPIAASALLAATVAGPPTAATASTAATAPASSNWQHAVLIYHSASRTQQQWEQHLMAVNAAGQFTGQWLFDAAIVTTQTIDGSDIMDTSLTGANLTDLINQEFADAAALDKAAAALAQQFGAPPKPIQVALALPWLDPQDTSVTVPGRTFNLSSASSRVDAADWFLQQIQSKAQAANWSELSLYGVYNQREDASSGWGDPSYLQAMNAKAHALGLDSIWVPYYDGPGAFSGAGLGFDVTSVQPEYSFRDAQYEGTVNDSRLYSAGTRAAGQDQSYEYELSGQGNSVTEEQVAHQYLAVAQATGASAHPQVFFTGLAGDLFDQVSSQSAVDASEWQTYTDLADYLAGQTISNTDLAIPWSPSTTATGSSQQTTWTPATAPILTSVRVDFSDSAPGPWRGQVSVSVTGPGGTRKSYAVRSGSDTVNPAYDSVFVPLPAAASGNNTVTSATITISRETGSAWPTVLRVVGAQDDPPAIANGNSGATSTASPRVAQAGQYSDSQPTSTGYYAGKLTDGQASPSGSWDWSGVMGWNSEGGPFEVTIDLGQPAAIGSVALVTHADQTAGINWPNNVSVAAGPCPPQYTGITGQSCAPAGTSGQASLASQLVSGGSDADDTAGTITLPMSSVSGQYVTVTGTCSGWCLLDEIKVLSPSGSVLSTGDSYTVVPTPTNGPGGGTSFGDDDYKLTDGAVVPVYGPQFADAVDGIPGNSGGSAQATWTGAHAAGRATVWMTTPNSSYGVVLPASVTIAWRNASGVWQAGTAVTPKVNCGPGACASLTLPSGAQVTGVRATFPGGAPASDWYMVSELSTQLTERLDDRPAGQRRDPDLAQHPAVDLLDLPAQPGLVQPGQLAAAQHDVPADEHGVDRVAGRAVDHVGHRVVQRAKVEVAGAEHHQVGLFARLQRTHLVLHAQGGGPAERGHLQGLLGGHRVPAGPLLHHRRPGRRLGRVRPLDPVRDRVLADGLHPRRVRPLEGRLRHDLDAQRHQRDRDDLEVGQAQRDADDRQAQRHPGHQMSQGQPPAEQHDPQDVPDQRARASRAPLGDRPPERPQHVAGDPERRDPERDRDDQRERDQPGQRVSQRHPQPAEHQPDHVQDEPHRGVPFHPA
jgi:Domain of unknown function (DUF4855)